MLIKNGKCVCVCCHVQVNTCASDLACSLCPVPSSWVQPYHPGCCNQICCFKGSWAAACCLNTWSQKEADREGERSGLWMPWSLPWICWCLHSLRSSANSAQNWMTDRETEWNLVKSVWGCISKRRNTGRLFVMPQLSKTGDEKHSFICSLFFPTDTKPTIRSVRRIQICQCRYDIKRQVFSVFSTLSLFNIYTIIPVISYVLSLNIITWYHAKLSGKLYPCIINNNVIQADEPTVILSAGVTE